MLQASFLRSLLVSLRGQVTPPYEETLEAGAFGSIFFSGALFPAENPLEEGAKTARVTPKED